MSFNWPDFPGHSGQRPSCLNAVFLFAVLTACLCPQPFVVSDNIHSLMMINTLMVVFKRKDENKGRTDRHNVCPVPRKKDLCSRRVRTYLLASHQDQLPDGPDQ